MLEIVDIGVRPVAAYRGIAPDALLDELTSVAASLRGVRVLHVNATPYGGGVSELLRSTVPILNDLGLVAHWRIVHGDERFFEVTKKLHNGLQGADVQLTESDREAYLGTSKRNAELFESQYDFVFLHDPQPGAILALGNRRGARWIWRCHIDTSTPNSAIWAFLSPHLEGFDAAIFTMEQFVPPAFPVKRVEIIPPAIDPLSPKNLPLQDITARQVLEWIGVELDRPLITQVSRFDPWKDPLGVIAAYRQVRREIPDAQLALVGSMALDDPEGWSIYSRIREEVRGDNDIHVLTNLVGVGNIEVNAFQRLSDVVIQKSIREGFGLVVSETLWKETAVVAGRAGGIPLQMADGAGGVLVDTVDECASSTLELLRDRDRRHELARQGKERVRTQFLVPRLLLNELKLMRELAQGWTPPPPAERFASRDPVCGMAVSGMDGQPTASFEGTEYRFCSDTCRRQFQRAPRHFLGLER
jgi:trehalose synthase